MKIICLSLAAFTMACGLTRPAAADLQEDVSRLALRVLAEKFGVDGRVADRYLAPRDAFDAAPCFSMSHYTRRPVNDVWKLRQQGLGWGQIAHRLGMHPGQFNKLRKSGAFDRDRIWASVLKERYGARESDLSSIKKRGGSMQDAVCVFVIAHKSGSSPSEVFGRYQKDRNWESTAKAHKVDFHDHGGGRHEDHSSKHEQKHAEHDGGNPEHEHGKGKAKPHDGRDGERPGKGRGRGKG